MTCFLPDGGKRPILDVNSTNLIFLWNVPNHLRIGDLKKDILSRYGRVKFIETFEAWTKQKIGKLIIEFDTPSGLGKFVQALSSKEVMNFDPPINFLRFNPGLGHRDFFSHVHLVSGVDLLSCGAIPPSFNWRQQPLQQPRNKPFDGSFRDSLNRNGRLLRGGVSNRQEDKLTRQMINDIVKDVPSLQNAQQLTEPNGIGRGRGRGGRGGGFALKNAETKQPEEQRKELANFGGFGRGRGGGRGGGCFSNNMGIVKPNEPQNDLANSARFGQCEEIDSDDEDFVDNSGFISDEAMRGGHGSDKCEEHSNSTTSSEFATSPSPPSAQQIVVQQQQQQQQQTVMQQIHNALVSTNDDDLLHPSNSPKTPDYQTIRAPARIQSASSIDDMEYRNNKTILIKNLKPGYPLDRILETLQNIGDVTTWKSVNNHTASFEFLEANDARIALLSAHDELKQLLGSQIELEIA